LSASSKLFVEDEVISVTLAIAMVPPSRDLGLVPLAHRAARTLPDAA
jgi:hypothetical protein